MIIIILLQIWLLILTCNIKSYLVFCVDESSINVSGKNFSLLVEPSRTPTLSTSLFQLFLLLTNICGLSPPLSGWHIKSHLSDTSFEANLAGIKFFRSELYGHVSSTGVDTPKFKALWHEICVVLVALGLDQAEIDRLQAEHCGEGDYIDVLTD